MPLTAPLAGLIAIAFAQPASGDASVSTPVASPTTQLVTLGTAGGPIARANRSQPANMLIINGKLYLVDCGEGTARQIAASGHQLPEIDTIFLTHLHFDHTAGLVPFMALDWVATRSAPVGVYGPPGTQKLVETGLAHLTIGEKIFSPQMPDLPAMAHVFQGHDADLSEPREIYHDEQVRVIAVENSHYGTMMLPARDYGRDRSYSLRFETKDRVIVFTGDTGPSPAVEKLAMHADILVSEVIDPDGMLRLLKLRNPSATANLRPLVDHMTREHLTPEQVGKMATRAGVKMVVLSHLAGNEGSDPDIYAAGVRREYVGKVVVAKDLDIF